jgi:hypothetical protein
VLEVGEQAKINFIHEGTNTLEVGECVPVQEGTGSLSPGTESYSDNTEPSDAETDESCTSNDSRGKVGEEQTIQAMSTRNTKRPEPEPETKSSSDSEGDVVDLTQTVPKPLVVGPHPGLQAEALDVVPEPEKTLLGDKDKAPGPSATSLAPQACEREDWRDYLDALKGKTATTNRPGARVEEPHMQPDREVPDVSNTTITAQQTKTQDKATSSNAPLREAPNEYEANDQIVDQTPLEHQILHESSSDEIMEAQVPPNKKAKSKVSSKANHGENPNPLPNESRPLSGLDEEAPPRPVMEEDWDDDYRECSEFGPLFSL